MSEPRILEITCAHCQGHIEFPVELHGQTTNCPHCGLTTALRVSGYAESSPIPPPPAAGFLLHDFPSKVVVPDAPMPPHSLPPISAVRDWAKIVSTVSKLCFVLCPAIIFFTVWVGLSGDGVTDTPYLVATGFLMLGLWLQIIAQLMFIRAALEDEP